MDFPFLRTEEQQQATREAAERVAEAKQALILTLSEITLHGYAMAQPMVCFDDAQGYTDERQAYEDAFFEVDFCFETEDGKLESIAWVECLREDLYAIWGYDTAGNEVCLGHAAPDSPVFYG